MSSWVLLVCCVCALKTSLSSVLDQSPGLLHVFVGDTFKVKCLHELPVSYCYSTTSWHKMDPRTGKLIQKLSQGPKTDQLEDNGKTCSLTISNATLQDSGMYYCTGVHNLIALIGNGTRVIVTDRARFNPSIILYSPLDVSGPIVPLQCLVMGAVPSQVQVSWIIDQTERGGWTESSWTENSDSAQEYTRAQITLSEEEWRKADLIECFVAYDGKNTSKRLEKQGNKIDLCAWLLYLGFGVAFLTIGVTVTVAVCLRKERQKDTKAKGCRKRNTQSQPQNYGKRDTLKPAAERPAWTDVEYSSLNPDSLNQRPNAVPPSGTKQQQ
ncbi:immunoglobulin kappa light chain-like isoform X1 [Astyanax mexicanus]|uniref:immunoglobulin kappa light chain-like isoform X1 n=2 Tax=Astyanax mexicanus TaxID=7994 RepID=UPI0020CB3F6A|nr:immunoglobulin kappa light chain-like isoform X1 [Astyanax mexicanus]